MLTDPSNPSEVQVAELRLAVESARQQPAPERLHLLLGALGKANLQTGMTLEALTCFREAIDVAHQLADSASEARHYGNQALAQVQIGNFDDGLRSFRKAHSLAQRADDWQVSCDALMGMASLFLSRESEEDALESLQEALEIAAAHQDRARQMRILLGLGETAWSMAELEQAEAYYQQALTWAKSDDSLAAQDECLDHLMVLYRMQNRFDLALQSAQQALAINTAGGADDAARGQRQLQLLAHCAELHFELGDLPAAQHAYQDALLVAEARQDLESQTRLSGSLGVVLGEQEQYPAALAQATKALTLAEQIGNARLYGEQLILYAYACQDMAQAENAVEACQRALMLFEQLEVPALVEKARQCLEELQAA